MALVKICPSCDERNRNDAICCYVCGNQITGVDETEENSPSTAPTQINDNVSGRENIAQNTTTNTATNAAAHTLHCACGAELRPGDTRCLYCGQSVAATEQNTLQSNFALRWPWGEVMPICGQLFVGRVPPAQDELASRLERDYPNVSRNHAELSVTDNGLYLLDHSLNGSFLNGQRLESGHLTPVPMGATLRFASKLEVSVQSPEQESLL